MDKFRFSALALILAAVSPAASLAVENQDGLEGLDGTMIVLDNAIDLESSMKEMGELDGADVVDDDCEDACNDEDESDQHYGDGSENKFRKQLKGDDFIENEDEMGREDDLDDRDDIDVDELREDDESSID